MKTALVLTTVGGLALSTMASPAPAEARDGFGPALAGGLVAGAVVGGLAASAYDWGPGYGYYGYAPAYYAPAYYGDYAYDYDYDYGVAPYRWGASTTTYYSAVRPAYYGYRYRHVVRPAFTYYGGGYPRWYRHW
ncbi:MULTISPECIES: hypothetical protein [unclassified Bradyrhizobium]|uniref:hypothetical protein n=1 Tax=unclassified Bradyrhizobium TaxID=2631580 RepID=UPI002479294F|nr:MULTISPECIES: hypothetical protein [unclassified Bradyrhizobium]WGS21799.1 hypothetical protein MTX22_08965 [Bradyrhizobium sp. ISRA463]WGS28750.1 hypothetical protein MTX19_06790 [Bradyrhizobium sp. ISRA464]